MALSFDTENKITYEELSPSLQNRIKKIIPRGEFDSLENLVSDLEHALNGIRISVVNKLTDISSPKNDQELAIVGNNGIYSCYVYGNSTWIKIPDGDIYYTVTIKQMPHQTIRFYYTSNEGTNTTSNIVLKSGTAYKVKVFPDIFWDSGTLNIPATGIVDDDMYVTVTTATRKYEYDIDIQIVHYGTGDRYGACNIYTYKTNGAHYGDFDPYWVLDNFYVQKNSGGTYSSFIAFYGDVPVDNLFNTCSLTLTANGTIYDLGTNITSSSFDVHGDIRNLPLFTTEQMYNILKSNEGKIVKLHMIVT